MKYYLGALKKYAVFSGRSRRSEYWFFVLFNVIFGIILSILDAIVFGSNGVGVFYLIYALAVMLPSIGVSVRRLHDTNRSGWWLLIAFIPIIGAIVLLVFTVQDSTPGDNKFGENPKLAST